MFATLCRLLVRTSSATALLAMLAGVPAGLIVYIGSPLPDLVPGLDETVAFFTRGIGDQNVIDGLAIALWIVWLLFTIAVIVEIGAAIRGVQAPRVRALGPLQGLASTLVAGLTAGVIAGSTMVPVTAATILGPPAPAAAASTIVHASPEQPILLSTSSSSAAQTQTVGSVTLVIDGCGYEHRVVKNESLWRIAGLCLGDPHRWPEIWELNKGKYWPHVSGKTNFTNPDLIFPGWVLDLPKDTVPPPGSQPVPPITAPTTPPTETAAPSQSASATVAPSASPTVAPSASPTSTPSTAVSPAEEPDGVVAPPASIAPNPPASPTPQLAPSSSTAQQTSGMRPPETQEPQQDSETSNIPDGITLPGGWITAGLGAALLTAAAWVWKRRRHRYIPTPITSALTDAEPDLAPPLAARTLIRQTLRRAHPETLHERDNPGPTVREYAAAEIKPELPQSGPTGTELAGAGILPLTAGLGLTGSAALDAARGLLVAVLSSGNPDDPDAQGRAVVPASALATLIGVSAVDLGPMRRLTVTSSFAEAIALVEEEIIRRSRIIAEAQVADVAALRADAAYAEPLPQLLLIADAPDPSWQGRLVTAIGLGERVEIGAAVLGPWPPGTTLAVNPDGTTSGGDGRRLAVLSADAAAEAITMLREAHGDHDTAANPDHRPVIHPATIRKATTPLTGNESEPGMTPQPDVVSAGLVKVRVLGAPAVLDRNGDPAPKLRAKSLELLVYLALVRNGAPLSQIMEAIWPDATLRRASERLSTCVANLRGVIRAVAHGEESSTSDSARLEPVVNTGGHYRLDPEIVTVDWWTVLDEVAQIAHAPDDHHRLKHLQTALTELGGPLADGADYEWIDTDKEHVRRTQIKICAQTAGLLSDSDPHEARTLLDTACTIDPLSEELARRAMRAAAAVGDLDGVRHRLDTVRRDLDDAGIELAANTEQLAATLIKQLTQTPHEDS